MKKLIINADDFGMSKLFNKKILELFEKGNLTATSVIVHDITTDQHEQIEKLKSLKKTKDISVGLHIDFKNESFNEQIQEQYKLFLDVFGFKPTHIDIHKGTYLKKGYPVIIEYCSNHDLPCKNYGINEGRATMTKAKVFAVTGLIWDEIEDWLKTIEDNQTYLLEFHPGDYDTNCPTKYNKVREVDAKLIEKLSKYSKTI